MIPSSLWTVNNTFYPHKISNSVTDGSVRYASSWNIPTGAFIISLQIQLVVNHHILTVLCKELARFFIISFLYFFFIIPIAPGHLCSCTSSHPNPAQMWSQFYPYCAKYPSCFVWIIIYKHFFWLSTTCF